MTLRVGECCCCPNLETGSKVIGVIEVLMGILSLLFGIFSIIKIQYADNPAYDVEVLQILLIVHGRCCLLGGCVLLIGVFIKNIKYLERFLALLLLNIVIFTSAAAMQMVIFAEYKDHIATAVIISCVIIDIIIDGFKIYFWIVIFSMYSYVKGVKLDTHVLDTKNHIYAKWSFTPNLRPL